MVEYRLNVWNFVSEARRRRKFRRDPEADKINRMLTFVASVRRAFEILFAGRSNIFFIGFLGSLMQG
jgi:hypothetical protein